VKQVSKFETYDVNLAAFLMLQGVRFIETVIDPKTQPHKPRVLMRFFDEKGIARDLERVFMGSDFKNYEDYRKYLLKSIHRTLKGLD